MKNKTAKIVPIGSWILVRPAEPMIQNENGLIIPDSVEKEQKAQGEVLSVGESVTRVSKGQTVLYGKYAGEEVQIKSKQEQKDRVDYVLLLEEDILARIEYV